MKFSYQWLKDLTGFKGSLPEMIDLFNRYCFDTEFSQDNLEIKLPPNRMADASGHWGMAKELAQVLKKKFKEPVLSLKKDLKLETKNFISVINKESLLCQRYLALYVELPEKEVKTPVWLAKRLEDCGLRPISLVVDIMNYVMLETGQPMHAFDFDLLNSFKGKTKKQLEVRLARKGEKMKTLDGKDLEFSGKELLIADDSQALALAGIKGGVAAEISPKTTKIIIEAANFEAINIRLSSRLSGIKTDASIRFENFLDPNLAEKAIWRAAQLLQEISGAKIAKTAVDVYPVKNQPKKIIISHQEIEKLAGFKISAKEVKRILEGFCSSVKDSGKNYNLVIDTKRFDISIKQDVIEEVLRFVGYDQIPISSVSEEVKPPETNSEVRLKWQVQDILVKLGFDEVMNYSLIKEADLESFRFSPSTCIKVLKPVSGEFTHLRPSLLVGILKNLSLNMKNFEQGRIFEIGKVFSKANRFGAQGGDLVPSESRELSLTVWGEKDGNNNFLNLKGSLIELFLSLGYEESVINFKKTDSREFAPEESLSLEIDGSAIGLLGNLRKDLLEKYDLLKSASYAEIWLDHLPKAKPQKVFSDINRFPPLKRDLSFFVPLNIEYSEIIGKMKSPLVESCELFDIFEKNNQKSLSFHLIFRIKDRTLTDLEVNQEMEKIISKLESLGAKIR